VPRQVQQDPQILTIRRDEQGFEQGQGHGRAARVWTGAPAEASQSYRDIRPEKRVDKLEWNLPVILKNLSG
jgi:hypothetical protein